MRGKLSKLLLPLLVAGVLCLAFYPFCGERRAHADVLDVQPPEDMLEELVEAEGAALHYPALLDLEIQKEVAIEQSDEGCVVSAAAMLLRRALIINGESLEVWAEITEDFVIRKDGNKALNYRILFNVNGREYHLFRKCTSNWQMPDDIEGWKALLNEHPEGLLIWCDRGGSKHGVVLTHYSGNDFYCLDSASGYSDKGLMKLENSLMGRRYGETAEEVLLSSYMKGLWVIDSGVDYIEHIPNQDGICSICGLSVKLEKPQPPAPKNAEEQRNVIKNGMLIHTLETQ
ncbi:MAG: hypothetical protein Q4C04_01845 [Clostridia bacterium]|nr:hypothetical protein [Clostridia bacterium]